MKPYRRANPALCALLCLALLAGCGSAAAASSSAPASQPPEPPSGSMGPPPSGPPPGGGFGGSGQVTNGTAATTIAEDGAYTGETYTSTADDENALRVDGATVTLEDITVEKKAGASSNTEDGDFYGQNAGFLALSGAQVTITGGDFTTSAQNGNAVFSYGEGTVVTISDATIRTSGDNSGGIQTTGGGETRATGLDVETEGNSSAAIRSDRGGGTVTVEDGTFVTNGTGSPAIYCTADISAANATLTATHSEAVVVEGQNSVELTNCALTGNMTASAGGDSENIQNIMLYQSMSGDAEAGESTFTASGGSITAQAGDMFYVTNTHSAISLTDVKLELANGVLLKVEGNSSSRGWGTAGANGGQVAFTAAGQALTGAVSVDTISTLAFILKDDATFEGTVNIVDNAAGGTAVADNAVVTIGEGCTWTLTGDCTVTTLANNGTIHYNGYTITLADGAVMQE